MNGDGFDIPKLERAGRDEQCGCWVEEWFYGGIHLTLHSDPEGGFELFADAGDWDREATLDATDLEGARRAVFAWVDALPTEEELARKPAQWPADVAVPRREVGR